MEDISNFYGEVFKRTSDIKPKKDTRSNVFIAYDAFTNLIMRWLDIDVQVIKSLDDIKKAKLIIFSGGEDVNPSLYGEPNRFSVYSSSRDNSEISILRNIPEGVHLLGICRGLQLINTYHGGTLYQDLNLDLKKSHNNVHPLENIRKDSLVGKYFITVNSLHHQAIRTNRFPRDVTSTFGGVPESIENSKMILVQFHPEMMNTENSYKFGKEILNWSEIR